MNDSVIFKEAVKLPAADRSAFLDRTCGADARLRLEVEALLRAHEQTGGFLHRPPLADATTYAGPGPERPGMRVGPFKLLQFLGEGGMGTVFLAEQSKPVRRMVALKIVKPGLSSSQILARFEAERQALALMDHPNIAKVLDAGEVGETTGELPPRTDANGQTVAYEPDTATRSALARRPYFVMELVKGVPITEYCDKNKLTPRQRLELFIPVCHAIQHAHVKGIIHRDIKPSNVLVALYDGKPVPKVIDFGVAKAMSEPLTERTLFTQIGQIVGTFEYMSPEQATLNQLDIDTRSDVYSLGVLLYELLTGLTPVPKERLKALAFDQMLRTIREEEAVRPSVRLSSEVGALSTAAAYRGTESTKLAGLLRGELDWIVMKCLEKERERRFVTAGQLAQDVQRYLNNEPVTACPPSISYRLRKAYGRNKAVVTAATAVAAALVVGLVVSTWQAVRATRAEREAVAKTADAVAASLALTDRNQELAKERDAVQLAREQLRETHYFSAMSFVKAAWDSGNVSRAIEILEETRPKDGEKDLRGFEWHFWDNQCHPEKRKWELNSIGREILNHSAISGDGNRLATLWTDPDGANASGKYKLRVYDLAGEREIYTAGYGDESSPSGSRPRGFDLTVGLNHDGTRVAVSVQNSGFFLASLRGETRPTELAVTVFDTRREGSVFKKVIPGGTKVALSPDGQRLAASVTDALPRGSGRAPSSTDIRLYDLTRPDAEPRVLAPAGSEPPRITFLTFSPDGACVMALETRPGPVPDEGVPTEFGTINRGIKCAIAIWDAASGERKIQHELSLTNVAFSSTLAYRPDGKQIAVASYETERSRSGTPDGPVTTRKKGDLVTLFDVTESDTLTMAKTIPIPDVESERSFRTNGMQYSADGRRLLCVANTTPVRILDLEAGRWTKPFQSDLTITPVAFHPDGQRLIGIGKRYSAVPVREGNRGRAVQDIVLEWSLPPESRPLAARPARPVRNQDRTTVRTDAIAAGTRKLVSFRNVMRPSDGPKTPPPEAKIITVFDSADQELFQFKEHTAAAEVVAVSRDGRWVASASEKETLIWNPADGAVHKKWEEKPRENNRDRPFGSSPPVFTRRGRMIRFSPDNRWLVRVEDDQQAVLLSLPDVREHARLELCGDVVFSGDGRRLIAVGQSTETPPPPADSGTRPNLKNAEKYALWDLESGREIASRTFEDSQGYSSGFGMTTSFSPDQRIAVCLRVRNPVIINTATGEMVQLSHPFTQLGTRTHGFSPDSRSLVLSTTGPNFLLRGGTGTYPTVVDLTTGQTRYRLEAPGQLVTAAYSPDGKRIASLFQRLGETELRLWDAATGREMLVQPVDVSAIAMPYVNEYGGRDVQNGFQLVFSPDGHRLEIQSRFAVLAKPGTVLMAWDATPRNEAKSFTHEQ